MDVLEKLKKDNYLILDGSMGANIIKEGIDPNDIISIHKTNKELLLDIHKGYLLSGCEVISVNSFNINNMNLKNKNLDLKETIIENIKIASEANDKNAYIAFDIGPSGAFPSNLDDLKNFEFYKKEFIDIFKVALNEKIDLILIETMYSYYEALGALKAARELNDTIPIFVSLTVNKDGFTQMGDEIIASLNSLKDEGANVVGINCSLTPKEMLAIIKKIKKETNLENILAMPNRGQPNTKENIPKYDMSIEAFAKDTINLFESGANVIGGCCGSDFKCMELIINKILNK